jgi:GTPase SAR1 family protein
MPRSPILSELRFVVVGAEGSGKTTFIRYALDLKKPMQGPVASKKMSLEGDVFLISLMEIQLDDVDTTADNTICWPDSVIEGVNEGVNEGISPPVNGVLVLYDVSERSSLAGIPSLLSESLDRKVCPFVIHTRFQSN